MQVIHSFGRAFYLLRDELRNGHLHHFNEVWKLNRRLHIEHELLPYRILELLLLILHLLVISLLVRSLPIHVICVIQLFV